MLNNLTEKQKQRVKVLSVICIIVLIIIIGISFTGKKQEVKKSEARKDKKFSVLSEKVEKDLWIAAEGQNIKAIEKTNEEIRVELDRLRKELEETKKQAATAKQEKDKKISSTNVKSSPPPSTPPLPDAKEVLQTGSQTGTSQKTPPGKPPAPGKKGVAEEKSSTIRVWQADEKKESEKKKQTKEKDHVWIPTGSITKAILLSGMDVPTSMGARSEPYPILMTLTDYSILPNRFRMDMKECFVIGAGYGNMVEERAYVRTETLSCIKNDGTPWEVSLKGQVMGEDGKLGMRGKVISKQGRQIAMSIVTGVLSGLGNALRPQTALSYINLEKDDNKVKTITPEFSDIMTGAGLTGIGNALNKISDYYLKLAEQMYPVIEIEAGREIEIVVIKGGKLTPQEKAEQKGTEKDTELPTPVKGSGTTLKKKG